MKIKNLACVLLLSFLPGLVSGQSEIPIQDKDYRFTYSRDEEGEGYLIATYYLENLGSENIMFFNFYFTEPMDGQEISMFLPADVLILKPGEKLPFLKYKTYSKGLDVNWNAEFTRYTGDSNQPILYRDYVYYYETAVAGDDIYYTYFLKNISEKGIMFYDFKMGRGNTGIDVLEDFPPSMFALRPGQTRSFLRFILKADGSAPSTNWWTGFITDDDESYYSYSVTSFEFCEGIHRIFREAATGFENQQGPSLAEASLMDEWFSNIHISGVNHERIVDLFILDYSGNIGASATLDEIRSRLETYRSIVKDCLPETFSEIIPAEDDPYLSRTEIKFEGEFEGNPHFLVLSIDEDYENDDMYYLKLRIEEQY